MSRTRALGSLALITLSMAIAAPSFAQNEGARVPANAQERAAYSRLDPLARSVFWSREVEINPADPIAGVKLSEALRQMGQNDQAVTVAEQVLVTQPQNIDAMLEIGRAHIARGQAFYGIAALEQAKALAPNDWRPLSLLGVAYEQAKRDDEALAAHRQAVALAPTEAVPLANLAMHMAASGDLAGAEATLRKATALPSATIQVRQNLALVVGLQGRLDEAERLARQDLPPESVDNNLAWLRAATGQTSATRSWDAMKTGG